MRELDQAFQSYLDGQISGWDLLEVVRSRGFTGFAVDSNCRLSLWGKK